MTFDPSIIYTYHSPFGMLSIRFDEKLSSGWFLCYQTFKTKGVKHVYAQTNQLNLAWASPEAVADAVYAQETGWTFWDQLPFVVWPRALEDWGQFPASEHRHLTDPGA